MGEKDAKRICPDMTTVEWQPALTYGSWDYQRLILHECIGDQCIAYEDGMCRKYMSNTMGVKDFEAL